MAHTVVLASLGSFGDIRPFLAVAAGLRSRGHRAVMMTSEELRERVEAYEVEFIPLRPKYEAARDMGHDSLRPRRGSESLVAKWIFPALRDTLEDLAEAIETTGADLLVSHSLVAPAAVAARRAGIRWMVGAVSPWVLPSRFDPSVPIAFPELYHVARMSPLGARAVNRLFLYFMREQFAPASRLAIDHGTCAPRSPWDDITEADRVIGLFSPLIREVQPDWPHGARTVGFAFTADEPTLDPRLLEFLDSGSPPVVLTLGALPALAPDAYGECVRAVRQLGLRAVAVLGTDLPVEAPQDEFGDDLFTCRFTHFPSLFARAAAIVHHAGIGTVGECLRAGRPMLLAPHIFDQFDNTMRAERLGVARQISFRRFTAERIARELKPLLDGSYTRRAEEVAAVVRAEDGVAAACESIAQLLGG